MLSDCQNLNQLTGNRGRLHSAHWLASLKLAARCPVIGCWPSCYIMKLCSRLFVLYCRSSPKDDKSKHFDPHFDEVRGGVEPRWKASAEVLFRVIELLFLSLTVEALQGKMYQNSLPSGEGGSVRAKISGGSGRPPANILIYSKGN